MFSNRRTSKRLSEKKVVSESLCKNKKQRLDSNKSIYFDTSESSDDDDDDEDTDVFTTPKRLSQKKEVSKGLGKTKQRIAAKKSIYFDHNESDDDSSKNDVEMELDSSSAKNVTISKYSNCKQSGNLSDSDSSSDEFKRAPISLDQLGDFEVFKKESSSNKNKSKLNGNSCAKMDESDNEEKPNCSEGYYDFSQIIKTQELITTMKSEFKDGICNEAKPNPSKVSVDKLKKNIKEKSKRSAKKKCNDNSNVDEVSQLLAMAEGVDCEQNESDESDQENETQLDNGNGSVEVIIQLPNSQKRKKSKFDVEAAMKRRINLVRKENQVFMHKVHLLCWIAHGNYLNRLLNNEDLMGLALSLIPSQHCYPPKHTNLKYLEKVVEWFINKITVSESEQQFKYVKSTIPLLQEQISLKKVFSHRDLVLIFVCMLRSLGIHARLVISLRAVPLKPPASELFVVSTKPENENKNESKSKNENIKAKNSNKKKKSEKNEIKESKIISKNIKDKNSNKMKKSEKSEIKESKIKSEQSKSNKNEKMAKKRQKSEGSSSQYFSSSDDQPLITKATSSKSKYFSSSKNLNKSEAKQNSTNTPTSNSVNIKRFSREKKNISKSYAEQSSSEDEIPLTKKVVKSKNENSSIESKSSPNKRRNASTKNTDDDFKPSPVKKETEGKKNIDRRVLSSDEDASDKKKIGIDYWTEVFLEEEEKWISVDLTRGRVHCIHKLYNLATSPVRYVLAWNNDKTIKDITRRYTPHWMTVTRKLRVDQDWWEETIAPYLPCSTAREREEDEDLDRQLQDQPLPKSVAEYKNHPLYALGRHLLKFQGIYPPDAPTVGFIRGEPVYSRSCIVELHTRETWIKEAKCVKLGEEPYKVVKARPKYDKLTGNVINNLPLPLFGHWQVEDYIPPPAVDGKVPRNEYGNVELYKPCMLPAGTVHLQLPSVNRVARKLNIDCAPAVVGWEFHCGGSHPILDGFIVCEEFKDVLLDAWNKEIDESARRAKEKVEQRVYGNWKRLIKGLQIRERLKRRYDFGPVPSESKKKHSGHRHRK